MALPSFKEAQSKLDDHYACFHAMTVTRHINLVPKYMNNIRAGIKEVLDRQLKFYSQDLHGVLVAYDNIRRHQAYGAVFEELPHLHFDIDVDVIVFRPNMGCKLKGLVNKVSDKHIGCLVHNTFNASLFVPDEQDREEWEGNDLCLGDEFIFTIRSFKDHNGIIFIRGYFQTDSSVTTHKSARTSNVLDHSEDEDNDKFDARPKRKKFTEDCAKSDSEANSDMDVRTNKDHNSTSQRKSTKSESTSKYHLMSDSDLSDSNVVTGDILLESKEVTQHHDKEDDAVPTHIKHKSKKKKSSRSISESIADFPDSNVGGNETLDITAIEVKNEDSLLECVSTPKKHKSKKKKSSHSISELDLNYSTLDVAVETAGQAEDTVTDADTTSRKRTSKKKKSYHSEVDIDANIPQNVAIKDELQESKEISNFDTFEESPDINSATSTATVSEISATSDKSKKKKKKKSYELPGFHSPRRVKDSDSLMSDTGLDFPMDALTQQTTALLATVAPKIRSKARKRARLEEAEPGEQTPPGLTRFPDEWPNAGSDSGVSSLLGGHDSFTPLFPTEVTKSDVIDDSESTPKRHKKKKDKSLKNQSSVTFCEPEPVEDNFESKPKKHKRKKSKKSVEHDDRHNTSMPAMDAEENDSKLGMDVTASNRHRAHDMTFP